MEKRVYHGSTVSGLKELKPHRSTHQKECVYATDNETLALLFMGRGRGDLDTCIFVDENGVPGLVERRPELLESIYKQPGYLYELDGKTFSHYDFLWTPEVISYEAVPVLKEREIPSIMEQLQQQEREGDLVIYRYPNRPPEMSLDNSDLIERYQDFEQQGIPGAIESLLEVYPEFTDRVSSRHVPRK